MRTEDETTADVIVVGAGAAGLWAAACAAEGGRSVLVLEKTPRTGTKVLASGGTRCNLTTTLGPEDAAGLFGERARRFLRPSFRQLPPEAVRWHFEELGVPTVEAALEKVFPKSQRARDVRDALESWARGAGARIRCQAHVLDVSQEDGLWRVELADGESLSTPRLLLAPGGKSFPRTGTVGEGYRWLERLELPLVEPVPALVPLRSPAEWVRGLSGIGLQEVEVRLVDGAGRTLGRRERPLLFTHQGVSGPGPMDLSEHVARAAPDEEQHLMVDLMPEVSREELRDFLVRSAGRPGAPGLARVLAEGYSGRFPRRLLAAVFAQACLGGREPRASALSKAARHSLVESLKALDVPVRGTLGFDAAEVTAGGLSLNAVDPGSMAVNGYPGLFVFGELLDLNGPIGGLNFQAAFATAEAAGRAAGR